MENQVRVRFAPSPTGHLHVGGARTALFNYLYAKNRNGKFILRIEDTDQARSTKESENIVLGDLEWLGLNWDEGPNVGGELGPYRQSERMDIYEKYAYQLLEEGKAYRCFCTDEELTAKKEKAKEEKQSLHYDGTCKKLTKEEIQEKLDKNIPYTIRFKVPEKDYFIYDLIRDKVEWKHGVLGDFIILRSDKMPVYNFCVVIDDYLMKISHVIRAEEHLPNTLRQVMLYEAFGWKPPKFAHASLILGKDKSKLSKRHGATSVGQFKEEGYLAEAMNNYLALLGWSDGTNREEFSMKELIKAFSIKRINKSPAVFDKDKLNWLNSEYIKKLDDNDFIERTKPFLVNAYPELKEILNEKKEWIAKIILLTKKRLIKLSDIKDELDFLFNYNILSNEMKEFFADDTHKNAGKLLAKRILNVKDLNNETFWEAANSIKKDGYKGKNLFHPLRAIISSSLSGLDMNGMVEALLDGKGINGLITIEERCKSFLSEY
jgi:glutamyl-tRNA synthetase